MNMSSQPLHEGTFRILDVIARSPRVSQRDLATSTGLSLGLVNLTIKRLIRTGHIKAAHLDRRKVEYILTPKGLMQKTRRTYSYLSRTIGTFLEYRRRLEALVADLKENGCQNFGIRGGGEIAQLVELVLANAGPGVKFRALKAEDVPRKGETVLDCRLNGADGDFGVSILSRILEAGPPEPRVHRDAGAAHMNGAFR